MGLGNAQQQHSASLRHASNTLQVRAPSALGGGVHQRWRQGKAALLEATAAAQQQQWHHQHQPVLALQCRDAALARARTPTPLCLPPATQQAAADQEVADLTSVEEALRSKIAQTESLKTAVRAGPANGIGSHMCAAARPA